MPYDLMLLADPGPDRARVLEILRSTPDLRPDPDLDNRFWLATEAGEAQVNIGTKDPVESVHVEFDFGDPALAEAVTLRTLALGEQLAMRVEDMQYGHEIHADSLPGLRAFWQKPAAPPLVLAGPKASRPWWKVW